MKSVRNTYEYHLEIKKSEFITTLIPCDDVNLAKDIIDSYKEKYHDANHNCVAYIIGTNERANDDGEPSGTAGMPMLNVIKKQGLENIIVIVTRYFGGIKLGAGGLTRAYSQSVVDALKEADIVEKHLCKLYDISIDYSYTKKFDYLLKVNQIKCVNIDYLDTVKYSCYIEEADFFDQIRDLTSNNYQKELISEDYIEFTNK